jgi:hypothetical protein
MDTWMKSLISAMMVLALTILGRAADPRVATVKTAPPLPRYVVVNEDLALPFQNEIAFYVAAGTQLTAQSTSGTGGYGIQGGFFGTSRLASIPSISAPCLYVSNAASNDIASFSWQSQQLTGNFSGSQSDDGSANGIGLAVNSNYLYASFTSSQTIATFALQDGCGLTFLGDVSAVGLQGGSVTGMAVNSNILVVAYGDGSIQSFNAAGGMPVSNNDLQNSTAFVTNNLSGARTNFPSGVDITQDGHFAIFGDISPFATVEVSDLTAGKLAKTVVHQYGGITGVDAGAVRLSPDQRLLYATNSESGKVTAFLFNPSTGVVRNGCVSPTLRGFDGRPWYGSVVARDATGTGNVLYVAEFGRDHLEIDHGVSSAIGILTVSFNGRSCTLTESSNSPVLLSFPGTLSLGVYPPRPF